MYKVNIHKIATTNYSRTACNNILSDWDSHRKFSFEHNSKHMKKVWSVINWSEKTFNIVRQE